MRHLASGVAVVAARDESGLPYSMTVSSITSLTDRPPSLLVCLHESSNTHGVLQRVEYFSVNLLALDQREISECCAVPADVVQSFEVGRWRDQPDTQTPFLEDSLAVFFCRISKRIAYGAHTIVIGDIKAVQIAEQQREPLIFCRGDYRQLS